MATAASARSGGRPLPPVAVPATLDEALYAVAERPDAVLVAGGTGLMPRVNSGARLPAALIALHRVAELRAVTDGQGPDSPAGAMGVTPAGAAGVPGAATRVGDSGEVVFGAAVTFAELMSRAFAGLAPALAQVARAIGSPQIRAAATLGGNLADTERDTVPVLTALGARVLLRRADPDHAREIPVAALYDREGRSRLEPGELIVAVRVPVVGGPQGFAKVGTRGGAARTVVSVALAADIAAGTVRCAVGNAEPGGAPVATAAHADGWIAEQVDWRTGAIADPRAYGTYARLVSEGCVDAGGPVSRGAARWADADYRRRAVEICVRRALVRALPPAGWVAAEGPNDTGGPR